MTNGALAELLGRADGDLPGLDVISADDLRNWPEGLFEGLLSAGVVVRTADAVSVICRACWEGHTAEVEIVAFPDGSTRAFHACPEHGRVEVDPRRLRQWRLSLPGLAASLTRALGEARKPREVLGGRLWHVASITLEDERHDLFLGAGLGSIPEPVLRKALATYLRPTLFTLTEEIPDLPFPALPLLRVFALTSGGSQMDRPYLEALLLATKPLEPMPSAYVFRRGGANWMIVFEGRALPPIRHVKGLAMIAELLQHPGEWIDARVLAYEGKGAAAAQSERGFPVLEPDAVKAYRHQLTAIRNEAKRTRDPARADELRVQEESIQRQLAAAVGRGGRLREQGSPGDKARSSVSQRIRLAITQLGALDPALALYLNRSLRRGFSCSYLPAERLDWQF